MYFCTVETVNNSQDVTSLTASSWHCASRATSTTGLSYCYFASLGQAASDIWGPCTRLIVPCYVGHSLYKVAIDLYCVFCELLRHRTCWVDICCASSRVARVGRNCGSSSQISVCFSTSRTR